MPESENGCFKKVVTARWRKGEFYLMEKYFP